MSPRIFNTNKHFILYSAEGILNFRTSAGLAAEHALLAVYEMLVWYMNFSISIF